ncbi:GTPase-activating protein gyp1 [Diplonema papillatum]|nr:GTPase-activating protein gyp1 [Diplonema papillatum]
MTGDGTGSFGSRLRNAFTREPKCKNLPQKVLNMLPTDDDWADAPPSGVFSEDEDANGWAARSAALSPVQPAPRKHKKKKPGKPGAQPAAAPAANGGGGSNNSSSNGNDGNDGKPKPPPPPSPVASSTSPLQLSPSSNGVLSDSSGNARVGKCDGEVGLPMSPFPILPRFSARQAGERSTAPSRRAQELDRAISSDSLTIGCSRDEGLRKLCWAGIPAHLRSHCWQLLCFYLPAKLSRRPQDIATKRARYIGYIETYYSGARGADCGSEAAQILGYLEKDIHRTCQKVPLFCLQAIQKSLERMLFIWSIRHPATGYVQGMNDLMIPFIVAFLASFIPEGMLLGDNGKELETVVTDLGAFALLNVEADVFWCFSAFLHNIQDHFTEGQPGIQTKLVSLQELLEVTDPVLAAHLRAEEVSMIQFAYKWINCLLIREFPLPAVMRLWDVYMSEGDDYPNLHVYVCLALLLRFSEQIRKLEFCELIPFLLSPPTENFDYKDVSELVSHAYMLQQRYPNACR